MHPFPKVKDSKVVYTGKFFKVSSDTLIYKDSHEVAYDYIIKKDFILVIPFSDNFLWMVEQYRHPVKKVLLEFPQGGVKESESIQNAASRELQEEVGLMSESMMKLGRIDLAKGSSSQGFFIFLAKNLKKGEQKLDVTESDLRVKKVSFEECSKLIKNNVITDGPTIAAFSLLLLNMQQVSV